MGRPNFCLRLMVLVFAFCAVSFEAFAHAILLGSSPEANQQLDESPSELVLNFNESVGPIFFKVLNSKGVEVGKPDAPRVDGHNMLMTLGEELPNGTYIMTYRVVSADTHPVGASIVFSVGEAISDTSDVSMSSQSAKSGWWLPVAVNRFVLYASVLFAVGSAIFLLWMNVPAQISGSAVSTGRLSSLLAGIAYLTSIGFGGSEMLMGGPQAIFSPDTWITGAGTTLGPSALMGVPGAIILFLAFQKARDKTPAGLALLGSILLVASFLVTGHAATAPPVWIMAAMVAVHIVCAGFWLAALLPLSKATKLSDVAEAGAVMTAFSTKAVITVGLLFVSGAIITWFQLLDPLAMLSTDYGNRLGLKIALFFALLGIAYYNKSVLTPALEKSDEASAAKMRSSIRKELALIAGILVAAVSLTLVTPPRALSDQANAMAGGASMGMQMSGGFSETVDVEGYTMKIEVTPATTGENMVMFTFTDGEGKPVDMYKVESEWSLPAAGLEGIVHMPEKMAPGMFHLMFSDLVIPGDWSVRVGAFVTDFDKYNFRTTVPVK